MGSPNTLQVCFTILLVVPAAIPSTDAFEGSCYRINYKAGNCGKFVRNSVSKEVCCDGNYKRAWSPYRNQGEWPLLMNSNQTTSRKKLDNNIHQNLGCFPCFTSCHDIKCDEDQKCVMKHGLPKCVCNPKCHLQHKSTVCGTDGRTYSSECHLLKRSCRKKQWLTVVHIGPCQTCKDVRCRSEKTCVLDVLLAPKCVKCPKVCHERKPICGTDNNTYLSRCFMKKASCETGSTIETAYKGPCKKDATCSRKFCRRGETCLTDLKTHQPRCLWCENFQKCDANLKELSICASDGSFYQSMCAFKHSSCRSMKALTVFPLQFCYKNATKTEKKLECKSHKHRKRKLRRKHRKEFYTNHFMVSETSNQATGPNHKTRIYDKYRSDLFKRKLNRNRKKKRRRKDCKD